MNFSLFFQLGRIGLCMFFLQFGQFAKAQFALTSSGNTLQSSGVSFSYSVGEMSGFRTPNGCNYSQGIIQPPRYHCVIGNLDFINDFSFKVVPNPVNDQLTIVTDFHGFTNYRVIGSFGLVVKEGQFNYRPIDLSRLPRGFYLVQVYTPRYSQMKSFKIIKN